MPVYFIRSDQIHDQEVLLGPDLVHHLRDVLRLKVGESLTLVDEHPRRYLVRVTASYPEPLELKIESEVSPPAKQPGRVHLAIGMLKGEKMDWVVQKATELGVARLTPLITERTIVRVRPERLLHQQSRWLKIVTEASQQSCRWSLPQIDPPIHLADFLAASASVLSDNCFRFLFSERMPTEPGEDIMRLEIRQAPESGILLIGPEGGWEPGEVSEAFSAGFLPVSLGEQILRAETAALSALAIVQYEMRNVATQCASDADTNRK